MYMYIFEKPEARKGLRSGEWASSRLATSLDGKNQSETFCKKQCLKIALKLPVIL